MLDISHIKTAAATRWPELITRLAGMPPELLNGKNHPCPMCGGTDRFRMIDKAAGALFCNQCFNQKNGDGLAAIMWLTDKTFPEVVGMVAGELGMTAERTEVDVVQEMAWRKGVKPTCLQAFGAEAAFRGKLAVCRVPMFDSSREKVGDFDMAPSPEDFAKGKMTTGSKHGLFVAEWPSQGAEVAVVEGVKDAAALHALGFLAVGLPTCRMDAAFAESFRGCDVTVVPDRDKAGTEGANETAGRLFAIASSIRIATLPTEYRETGGDDVRDVLRLRDGEKKLRDAIHRAPQWLPVGANQAIKLNSLAESLQNYINDIGTESKLLPLGLPDVDKALAGGVLPGEMVIMAGRPSHGKSACMLQAIHSLASVGPALILSEEMGLNALTQRFILAASPIPESQWADHKDDLNDGVWDYFGNSHSIYIAESCGTVGRAIEAMQKAKAEHDIVAVAVDYVQMLDGPGSGRYEKVSYVSTQLKRTAVALDIVLLAVCQLNRQTEMRMGKGGKNATTSTPRMSDLRDSGQLEQDADVILFMEWPCRTSPEAHSQDEYRIFVAKNRNRRVVRSIVECVFKPERQLLYPEALPSQTQTEERMPYNEFNDFA